MFEQDLEDLRSNAEALEGEVDSGPESARDKDPGGKDPEPGPSAGGRPEGARPAGPETWKKRQRRVSIQTSEGKTIKTHGITAETGRLLEDAVVSNPNGSTIRDDYFREIECPNVHLTYLTEAEGKALLLRLRAKEAETEPVSNLGNGGVSGSVPGSARVRP